MSKDFRTPITIDGSVTAKQVIGTSGTVTTNTPVLNLTQSWNSGAVTFEAIKLDVTSAVGTSDPAALLMNLKVGGVSQFSVTKVGTVTAVSNILAGGNIGATGQVSSGIGFICTTGGIYLQGSPPDGTSPLVDIWPIWNSALNPFTGIRLSVTNTLSAASSLLMDLRYTGASKFSVAPNGNVNSVGTINGVQVMSTGILSGGYLMLTGFVNNPSIDAVNTWSGGGTYTGIKLNITNTSSAAASNLLDLQVGGVSQFAVRVDGYVTTDNGMTLGGNTITADAPVINASQTWNNGAVKFTGFKVACSGPGLATSLIMDLHYGGASKFNVRYDGTFTSAGAAYVGLTANSTLVAGLSVQGVAKNVTGPVNIQVCSDDVAASNLAGVMSLITTATAGDRRLTFYCLEQGVAWRNVTFCETAGNVGMGLAAPTARLHCGAGAAAAGSAPFKLTAGTSLTTPEAGAIEYDGVNTYVTNETTSGRALIRNEQTFRLQTAGGAITTIANFFGATSNIPLVANGHYEIEIIMYFAKTTASTVTISLINTVAATGQKIEWESSPIAGVVAPPGTATNLTGVLMGTPAATTAIVTGTLATGVNHFIRIRMILRNATGTSLQIQATSASGSLTPSSDSRWYSQRLPSTNVGTFAA